MSGLPKYLRWNSENINSLIVGSYLIIGSLLAGKSSSYCFYSNEKLF